jgi:hypothetical protein
VIVAVRRRHGRERAAAVGRSVEPELGDVDLVFVLRVDEELVEIERAGAVSVAINWSNPNEIYAGAWRAQRKPWTIISGGPAAEGGVYKSTDGGDRWTRSSSGFPDDLVGKVWIDIAQSNPKVVYAQVEAKGNKGSISTRSSSTRRTKTRSTSPSSGSTDRPTAAARSRPCRRRTATIT